MYDSSFSVSRCHLSSCLSISLHEKIFPICFVSNVKKEGSGTKLSIHGLLG